MSTSLYNPDRKSKNDLIAEFVVRTDIYNDIMDDLERSKMTSPEQHYILVGQRGTGKTTLLNRLKYGIEDSAKLKDVVIPILFSEEQYNISELVNLWETIAQHLEDYYGFEGLYEKIEENISKKDFEELSYEILAKNLKKAKKKIVLLIDNIGDILKRLEKIEIHRLREILQTESEIRIIAGSPFYLETLLDYQQPFFEFFKIMRLDGLNKQETQQLLMRLAEINGETEKIQKIITDTPERVETLRTLTGGVPRTIALMFTIFIEFNNEDTVKDLEKILDAVTPLYKHRMDDLPTQQQKIVDAVAKNWDGISVKELRERTRIESKIISAQLAQLHRNQIIDIKDTGTKNNLYFLRERFFNIWYLMRYGRKYDKQRVIWLVKFLESWCSVLEIEQRIIDYAEKIKSGSLDESVIKFYGEVYSGLKIMRSEIKILLKESTPEYLAKKITIEDKELVRIAGEKIRDHKFKEAVDLLIQLKAPDGFILSETLGYLLDLKIGDHIYFREVEKRLWEKINDFEEDHRLSAFQEILFFSSLFNNIMIFLYINKHENAHNLLDLSIPVLDYPFSFDEGFINILMQAVIKHFLIYEQFNVVKSFFIKSPVWKDKLKPTYYVAMKLMDDKNEFIKMTPEIAQEVDKIIEEIKKESKKLKEIKNSKT